MKRTGVVYRKGARAHGWPQAGWPQAVALSLAVSLVAPSVQAASSTQTKPTEESAPKLEAEDAPKDEEPSTSDDADGDVTQRARRMFEKGARAFEERRNLHAIIWFRRANAELPSPRLHYNIGMVYEDMGDNARALSEYRAYLRKEPDPPQRSELLARIARMEEALYRVGLQQLTLLSEPAGARVVIDSVPRGVTPLDLELSPGEHELELSLPGHRPLIRHVDVDPNRATTLESNLETLPPPPEAEGGVRPLTWTILGTSLAAIAGGIVFDSASSGARERASSADTEEDSARASGEADAYQLSAYTLLGAGSVLLITGGVFLLSDLTKGPKAPREQAAWQFPCDRGFCGVVHQGRF